jgi:hypothetical protein
MWAPATRCGDEEYVGDSMSVFAPVTVEGDQVGTEACIRREVLGASGAGLDSGRLILEAYMLLLPVWLRKFWLNRALRGYPLYDLPHKVEERLLSREQAVENYDYFMRVREQRVAYFRNWLYRNFWVSVSPDEKGVRALNEWGNRFAGLLLTTGADGRVASSYFTYDPPWTGAGAGYNVLFDMGITLGEYIIANCPKLHWDIDPISAVLPRTGDMLKRSPNMSFQRPQLAHLEDPGARAHPLHRVHGFARQMRLYTTTWEGRQKYWRGASFDRQNIRYELLNMFAAVRRSYHEPYVDPRRAQMTPQEYLALVDRIESGEEEG